MTEVYLDERQEPIRVVENISTIYDRINECVKTAMEGHSFALTFIPLQGINGEIIGVDFKGITLMIEKQDEEKSNINIEQYGDNCSNVVNHGKMNINM